MSTAVAPSGPLSGYRIVELGMWVAGPAAAGLMADWGAEVIKVEPPTGDPQRAIFGALGLADIRGVPPFEIDNRGKQSVVIDLRTEEGLESMRALLATADVFITNVRPGALERLGLDHESVLARFPRLVYGSLTGYGLQGPERDRAGYDVGAFWARSGMAHSLVPPDQMPPAIRGGLGDHVTGIALAAGVLAKLLERERTGSGGLVATSLLRTGMYTIAWDIGIQLRFAKRESTRTRERTRAPLMNCYRAGDGRAFWLLTLEGDRHWPNLVAALNQPGLGEDIRFTTAKDRLANSVELVAALDHEFAQRTFIDIVESFDNHDVWWAPINSIVDVINDPQARAAGAFVEMQAHPGEDSYVAVNSPVDFGVPVARRARVPKLGEHTDTVLGSLAERS
jgi:crotonobetainyl-CoA:carnitine CoA-transferase CaiB-like acyl-CoA transferase